MNQVGRRLGIHFNHFAFIAPFFMLYLHGFGCSCGGYGNIFEKIKHADVVLQGTLDSILIDSANHRKTLLFRDYKILGKDHGILPAKYPIATELNSEACGFSARRGDSLIIFAHEISERGKSRKRVETTLCSGNIVEPTKSEQDSLWSKKAKRLLRQSRVSAREKRM